MTTKHTCGGPIFGKKTPGCPRCDEMLAGSPPVRWSGFIMDKKKREEAYLAEMRAHDCKKRGCGPICVAFDY